MEEIKSIITEYTGIPANQISEDMSLNSEIGLDSFAVISMIAEIEDRLHVTIPDYEISSFQTLSDIANYIFGKAVWFAWQKKQVPSVTDQYFFCL